MIRMIGSSKLPWYHPRFSDQCIYIKNAIYAHGNESLKILRRKNVFSVYLRVKEFAEFCKTCHLKI